MAALSSVPSSVASWLGMRSGDLHGPTIDPSKTTSLLGSIIFFVIVLGESHFNETRVEEQSELTTLHRRSRLSPSNSSHLYNGGQLA